MTLKARIKKLEQSANAPGAVDVAAILDAGRAAVAAGLPPPIRPRMTADEIATMSKTALGREMLNARRRIGELHESEWPHA